MTVLQALARHYDRLVANGEAPEYGYSRESVSYAIVLSPGGEGVDVIPLLNTSGRRPRPSLRPVPRPVPRTSGIASNFLWDKTAYVLGMKRDRNTKLPIPAEAEHDAFKALHKRMLANAEDEGLTALQTFLREWQNGDYAVLHHADDMLDTNVVFRLDGDPSFLHERPAARSIWMDYLEMQAGTEALCLVSGRHAPMERLHPKVKGVKGAQSSGASIVSFNLDAFESFGKCQGGNAPVSERAAFAYTSALNTLLAPGSRRRIQIGDATTVFWAEARGNEVLATAAEDLFSTLADPSTDEEEAVEVSDKLSAVAEGRPLAEVEPAVHEDTRFHVLGLAPNAGRLSVRFWCEDSIGAFARRMGEHWRDLRLEPTPWRTPPAVWRLLYETAAHRKTDNIPPVLSGTLIRAVLTGGRYPHSLLAAVVARMRADKNITGLRAAICKASLARDHRLGFEKEHVPVSLNREETNPAYRLGRLFAVYEGVQRAALPNINATIKDRYFSAASATPASVFPLLERNSANHIALLRKSGKGGRAHWFEHEIDSILDGVDTSFPRSLHLQDQGRFAIGYHHQRGNEKHCLRR